MEELHNETKFPTAMAYGSDRQWSDTATVCSNESEDELEDVPAPAANDATVTPMSQIPLSLSSIIHQRYHEVSDASGPTNPADEMDSETSKDQDCDASLDVETHSVGGHSFVTELSQDDATSIATSHHETTTDLGTVVPIQNGRQSPGGTIYKGRGERRYKGRYMHLPLKRFHHQVQDHGVVPIESASKRRARNCR